MKMKFVSFGLSACVSVVVLSLMGCQGKLASTTSQAHNPTLTAIALAHGYQEFALTMTQGDSQKPLSNTFTRCVLQPNLNMQKVADEYLKQAFNEQELQVLNTLFDHPNIKALIHAKGDKISEDDINALDIDPAQKSALMTAHKEQLIHKWQYYNIALIDSGLMQTGRESSSPKESYIKPTSDKMNALANDRFKACL